MTRFAALGSPIIIFVAAFGAACPASGGTPGLGEQRPGVFRHVSRQKSLVEGFLGLLPGKKAAQDRSGPELDANRLKTILPRFVYSSEILPILGKDRVLRGHQEVAGAKIAGTWFQSLRSKDGKPVFASGASLESPPVHLEPVIQKMTRSRDAAVARIRHEVPSLGTASHSWDPRIEIHEDPKTRNYRPIWIVDFVDEDETGAWTLKADENGAPLSLDRAGTGLVEGNGIVFPEGPVASPLTEVKLSRLTGDGYLSSDLFLVRSAMDPQVWSPDHVFKYGTGDARFDEVQTYFFAERAITWFRSRFGTQLAQRLEIKTHVGPAGRSNAAFYFRSRIFLGTGDGVTYKDLMRDPSVVIHETTHAFIDELSGLPSQGEGGALNEGFADFFTAAITGNPNIGETSYLKGPFRRTLLNELKAYQDFAEGVYVSGSIVAGTLWDVRKLLGDDKATRLAVSALARLGEGSKLEDFPGAVLLAGESVLLNEDRSKVTEALAVRGWRVPSPIRR